MDLIETFNHSGVFAKLSLLVGFAPLAVALLYVVRPLERTLAFMRPVSLAAIFAGVCGLVIGFIVIFQGLSASANADWRNVYMGMSEALVPAFLNFGLLSASWLLVAAGMWRRTP
jgi:biopolymer transport protein ExbB/TolQ